MSKWSTWSKWRDMLIILWEIQVLQEQTLPLNVRLHAWLKLRVCAVWRLEWGLRRPQKFGSGSHSITCLLFCCLQLKHERSYSDFENGCFLLIIADTVYRLKHYRLESIKCVYLDVSIWCLRTWVANHVTEEMMGGFVTLAALTHRVCDFILERLALAWRFTGLSVLGRCQCLVLP